MHSQAFVALEGESRSLWLPGTHAAFWPSLPCPPSLPCQYVPAPLAGGVPSWAVQLARRGQEARAAPVPAAPTHRKASTSCFHVCRRDDVSVDLPVACGLMPLQLCESHGTLSCRPRVPRGCLRGGDHPLLCWVRELQLAAQREHSSGWGTRLWRGETQISPKTSKKSGGVIGW